MLVGTVVNILNPSSQHHLTMQTRLLESFRERKKEEVREDINKDKKKVEQTQYTHTITKHITQRDHTNRIQVFRSRSHP